MELQDRKCVMILNEELPAGVLANAAGILGITLGKQVPDTIGPDICDKNGRQHLGIVALPVPVLKADKEKLKAIREKLFQPEFADCVVVDFTDVDQSCQNYEDYIARAAGTGEEEVTYLGIGICGARKKVNRLSGSLPLLR